VDGFRSRIRPRGRSPARGWKSPIELASRWVFALVIAWQVAGCATAPPKLAAPRPFAFEQDTFAFANDLVWEYYFDENGKWTSRRREPPRDYTHHCFVVARAARQFFQFARFDPQQPVADEATYRRLVRAVVSRSPRRAAAEAVIIPGYPNLRAFSQAHERLLKEECGAAWESYVQRGHWRMTFPFSRGHQANTAGRLLEALRRGTPPVVHLVRFPSLTINHAGVVFDAAEAPDAIRFALYDPNEPGAPTELTYDRATRTYSFPSNAYFIGGRVDVYEIYRGWCY
jgi:hypothetical protein